MPELPEVETIANALRSGGRGGEAVLFRTVQQVHLFWPGCLALPEPPRFLSELPGATIREVTRRGKFLCLDMGTDFLFIHLRMSGDIRVETLQEEGRSERPWQLHDRMGLVFADGLRLAFNDPRKFGRVWWTKTPQEVVGDLGPEPFDPHFSADALYQRLRSVRRQIKPLLLNQHFLAGLGNIYTDEALFQARIHPRTPSDRIPPVQAASLWTAIRNVLTEGIRRNGASIDWVYRGGDFQNQFAVYQRTGEPCPVCGTPVQRLLVGQRGTHICPQCQPESLDLTDL